MLSAKPFASLCSSSLISLLLLSAAEAQTLETESIPDIDDPVVADPVEVDVVPAQAEPVEVDTTAESDDVLELDTFTTEDSVEDDIGFIPTEPVDSVFGFGKTLLETPRSATSITVETIERFGVRDIDDLVLLSPGTFTQSFFGVAGSLDVRGTPGETYFRGIRRLDNPGNYPTPLGATDRVDIVRGPASPIFGPSKIGGYLNFIPKSARAETGQYLEEPIGEMSVTVGSWSKSIITAEVGGPMEILGKTAGYYVYGEVENSDSFYENSETGQNIFQASFNADLTDRSRLEFGGMYHDYDGNQIAGWNRLTQDLIDNGTYITGSPQPADTNQDGFIQHAEYNQQELSRFVPTGPATVTDDTIPENFNLVNPGTTQLGRDKVLVSADDLLKNQVTTLYLDYIFDNDDFTITNKNFYETYDNLNENAYGFSQFHKSYVVETQLVFATEISTDWVNVGLQASPSYRYTDFRHGDDFANELFDRRDLTQPASALNTRELSTRTNRNWSTYSQGHYDDIGLAFLADVEFEFGLDVLLGVRHDWLSVNSNTPANLLLGGFGDTPNTNPADSASDNTDGGSWTASISYDLPFGVTPYVTRAIQSTIIAGQGAEIQPESVRDGTYFDQSKLLEAGLKGSFLDGRLFAAAAWFRQERTDFSAQNTVTNQSAETKGVELEFRFLVTESLAVNGAFTDLEVINTNINETNTAFSFFGADDLVNVSDPALIYGGQFTGLLNLPTENDAKKAGIPEQSFSLGATYDFLNGFYTTVTYFYAESTNSGISRAVELPSYDLWDASVGYSNDTWGFQLVGKNLADEDYFRANFAELFGSQIVLPEQPRRYEAQFTYKF